MQYPPKFPRVLTIALPTHKSDKSLADRFATYFQDKIVKICDCFPSIDNTNPDLPSSNPAQFTAFSEVSVDTIHKILLNSPTKSCLLDIWPNFIIKDCADILVPSLTKLINLSLLEGCIPDGFKSAVVTPLIKKPTLPADDLKNYRPVSGLSFLFKLV